MKLAFSTNAFRKHPIEETISILAGIGYEGIELMADSPHAWPPETTSARLDSIRSALRRHRMAVANVNAFMMCAYRQPGTGRQGTFHWPSWIDGEEAAREARIAHTIACAEIAAALGARTISTEPGGPLAGIGREDAYRLYAAGLRRAAARASALGVTVLVEPEPGLLIERSGEYEEFAARHVDFPGTGLNCDVGHFYCGGEDPAAVIRRPGCAPMHVHLEDIAADRTHHHIPPGEGAMDFESIFAALREARYDGWVTIELYPFQANAAEVAKLSHDRIRPFLR